MTEGWPHILQGIRQRLSAPVDAASVTVFRVMFGLILLVGTARFVAEGWVETLFVEPTFFFKYIGFEWVEVWPAWGMYLHYAVLGLLCVGLVLGFYTRVMAGLFFLGFTYLELMDVTNYLNHYYLVSLIALYFAIIPSSRSEAGSVAVVPTWALWLLRFQVAVVYGFAALAKAGPDWLLYGQPMNIWMTARSEMAVIGPLLGSPDIALGMSWAGFVYDLTIVPLLLWKRTRPLAFLVVLAFHGMTHLLFDIGLFPFIMTAAATLFFAPDWPRGIVLWVQRKGATLSSLDVNMRPFKPVPRWAVALGVSWCLLQVVVPLRHFALPGDVLWNEAGMRWAWKVMVREKNGAVTYQVRLPEEGRLLQINPARYLTRRQANEMSGQPDLILQLAHHIAAEFEAKGHTGVEVRVDASASLNGRPAHRLIDSDIDLARVEDTGFACDYCLAAPTSAPIKVRSAERAGGGLISLLRGMP